MSAREDLCAARQRRVYRTRTHTARDEALAAFMRGEGEVRPECERFSEWHVDAQDVKA